MLLTQVKFSLQTTGLVTQLHKIKDQYDCLVKLTEAMESAKYLSKKRCKQSKNLSSVKTLAVLTITLKKNAKQ